MNDKRKLEILKKYNNQLTQQIDFYKDNIGKIQINPEDDKRVKGLILDLETIKTDWMNCLNKLYEHEKKYNQLIKTTETLARELRLMKKKYSWIERIKMKIRKSKDNKR